MEKKKSTNKKNDVKEKHDWNRHSITNDVICVLFLFSSSFSITNCYYTYVKINFSLQFTGAGIFKSLSDTGNVLILVDEFDSEHKKSNIFTIDNKSGSNPLYASFYKFCQRNFLSLCVLGQVPIDCFEVYTLVWIFIVKYEQKVRSPY